MFFYKELKNQEAKEGETGLLCCEISKPGVSVEWKKETMLLKPGEKYEIGQDGCKLQLKIHDLKSSDSGSYKCCAGSLVTTASIVVRSMLLESRNIHWTICFMNSLFSNYEKFDHHFIFSLQKNPCFFARNFTV